jgi:hypothetical protein
MILPTPRATIGRDGEARRARPLQRSMLGPAAPAGKEMKWQWHLFFGSDGPRQSETVLIW